VVQLNICFFFEACTAFRSIQTISAAETKDANTFDIRTGKPLCFKSNPMKKERPKGLGFCFGGPKRYQWYTAREKAMNANRMPTHAAAGRPEANGGQGF
jgi:hypothetical protein